MQDTQPTKAVVENGLTMAGYDPVNAKREAELVEQHFRLAEKINE